MQARRRFCATFRAGWFAGGRRGASSASDTEILINPANSTHADIPPKSISKRESQFQAVFRRFSREIRAWRRRARTRQNGGKPTESASGNFQTILRRVCAAAQRFPLAAFGTHWKIFGRGSVRRQSNRMRRFGKRQPHAKALLRMLRTGATGSRVQKSPFSGSGGLCRASFSKTRGRHWKRHRVVCRGKGSGIPARRRLAGRKNFATGILDNANRSQGKTRAPAPLIAPADA